MDMAIIQKKVGRHTYIYAGERRGDKSYQSYIGTPQHPQASALLAISERRKAIPREFEYLFWDTSIEKIGLRRNASYIIERVLEYGDLDAVEWLSIVYTGMRIIETLMTSRKISTKSRTFWALYYGIADS